MIPPRFCSAIDRFGVGGVVVWGFGGGGCFWRTFFELWIFDDGLDGFSFHDRFVGTGLNITV